MISFYNLWVKLGAFRNIIILIYLKKNKRHDEVDDYILDKRQRRRVWEINGF